MITVSAVLGTVLIALMVSNQPDRSGLHAPLAANATSIQTAPAVDERALRVYRDMIARDPRNVQAAVNAANLLYDAQRYVEAIPLYQQAFALNPSDVNVSTDLGTASGTQAILTKRLTSTKGHSSSSPRTHRRCSTSES